MSARLAILIVALTLTAGCLSSGDGPTTSSTSAAPTTTVATTSAAPTTSTPSATTTTTSAAPVPPVANVTADVVNGTSPLVVNFTLSDTAGSDAELAWTINFGDGNATNGTILPSTVPHAFNLSGEFNVVLTIVSDAGESSDDIVVTVEAGSAAIQTVEGEYPLGGAGCAGPYDPWPAGVADGVAAVEFDVDPLSIGRTYTAVFTFDTVAGADFGAVDFYDADGAYLGGAYEAATVTGEVPAGAALGVLSSCVADGGASVLYTV